MNLIHGDAIGEVGKLHADSVDLLVTDPPYFLPSQTTAGSRKNPYRRTLADTSVMEYAFSHFFEAAERILKPSASAYVFCDSQSYPVFYRVMFPYFKYVRTLVWDRMTSYNGYTWRRGHELIAWGEGPDARRIPTGDGDVLRCRGVPRKDRVHPVQKPLDLITALIAKHEEAKVVLDPYMGGGTTGVACAKLKREFIGIELDETYFEIAQKRIKDASAQMILDLREEQDDESN